MKRLFTFGCSFTGFRWPTWADILGREFEYYENWGTLGAGNQFIFNSLIECKTRHQFTSDDYVMIMWTNVAREDRYIGDKWINPGNILTQDFYDKNYVEKIFCERGFLIRDIAVITASIDLLKSWNVNFELMSMVQLTNVDQYNISKINDIADVLNLYKDTFTQIKPSIFEMTFNNNWYSRSCHDFLSIDNIKQCLQNDPKDQFFIYLNNTMKNMLGPSRPDPHPTPMEHLEYLEKVLPNYNISIETRNWIKNYKLGDKFDKHFPNRL